MNYLPHPAPLNLHTDPARKTRSLSKVFKLHPIQNQALAHGSLTLQTWGQENRNFQLSSPETENPL